jgi:hypothetical protein
MLYCHDTFQWLCSLFLLINDRFINVSDTRTNMNNKNNKLIKLNFSLLIMTYKKQDTCPNKSNTLQKTDRTNFLFWYLTATYKSIFIFLGGGNHYAIHKSRASHLYISISRDLSHVINIIVLNSTWETPSDSEVFRVKMTQPTLCARLSSVTAQF